MVSSGGKELIPLKRRLWSERTCETAEGEPFTLRCYLLTEELRAGARLRAERYGVRLELARGDAVESAEAPALTMSPLAAAALADALSAGVVTPSSLPEVLADWKNI